MSSKSLFQSLNEKSLARASWLYGSVLAIMVAYIALMLIFQQAGARLVAPFLILGVGAVALVLQQRKRDMTAMMVFVWGAWCAVTLQGFIRNGVENAALFAYPAMFLLGGWVLGVRQGIFLGLASIFGSLMLAIAEKNDWILSRAPVDPIFYWLPMAVVMLASMAAMMFILKAHWDGMEQALELNTQLQEANAALSLRELALQQSEHQIKLLNEQLEIRVEKRTAELTKALEDLHHAQDELVQSGKLASLGQLVAGVAHELNTPIGNALMTTTAMGAATQQFASQLGSGAIKKSTLKKFVEQIEEGATLAERSLHRASDLVRSFKQVAVDQASERQRSFDLAHTISEVVDTLRPNLRGLPWVLEVDIPEGIDMDSYPGPLGQITINLVMNALLHAFEGRTRGCVKIAVTSKDADSVALVFADDGVGIAPEHLSRVFDPFFTTKLGQGGSGLGLSIVHRLVTQVLGGTLRVESKYGQGAQFILQLPLKSPDNAAQP
jgi:signal transduction histidine kinase